jgi:hypothetical protein
VRDYVGCCIGDDNAVASSMWRWTEEDAIAEEDDDGRTSRRGSKRIKRVDLVLFYTRVYGMFCAYTSTVVP